MIDIDKIVLEWSSRVKDRKLDAKNSYHRKILKEVLQYFNHSDKFIDAFLYNLKADNSDDLYTEAILFPEKDSQLEDALKKKKKMPQFKNLMTNLPGGDPKKQFENLDVEVITADSDIVLAAMFHDLGKLGDLENPY